MVINNTNYCGVILADDMGLGKTLQCLTVFKANKVLQGIFIVTPSSLNGIGTMKKKRLKTNRLFACHYSTFFRRGTNLKLKKDTAMKI